MDPSIRSRSGKPNQIKGQNEKFMNFAHFCEFWCFSLGKQARFTLNFCSGMPLRKVHELTFLWFGLPGPLLILCRGKTFRNSQENSVCTRCAAIVNHNAIVNSQRVVNLLRAVFLVQPGPFGGDLPILSFLVFFFNFFSPARIYLFLSY